MKPLQGSTWVDLFGAVVLARLVSPMFHLPPMNPSEAAIWSATIASFAATKIGGPKT
jgi:hypothetical protein